MKQELYPSVSIDALTTQGGFTATDLMVSNQLCHIAAHPDVYGTPKLNYKLPKFGLQFKDRIILDLDKIIMDDTGFGQKFRSAANAEYENISRSIRDRGFQLSAIPMSVLWDEFNNTYHILEGRTRIAILVMLADVKRVMVDVYQQYDSSKSSDLFSMYMNRDPLPKGVTTEEDIIKQLTENFHYDASLEDAAARRKLYDDIDTYLETIGYTKLSNKKITEIIKNKVAGCGGSGGVKYFYEGAKGVKQYCEQNLGIKDDENYKYVYATTDEWNSPLRAIAKARTEMTSDAAKLGKVDHRTIRLITFTENLASGRGVIENFYLKNIRVGKKMEKRIKEVFAAYYPGKKFPKRSVEIYGTIPQCQALNAKYPVNKVILYSEIEDSEYNLFGEKSR